MVAIVTASILSYSYTIPHNSPSYLFSFSSSLPWPSSSLIHPPLPSSLFLTLFPSSPAPLPATDIPFHSSSFLVVSPLFTLYSPYSIPSSPSSSFPTQRQPISNCDINYHDGKLPHEARRWIYGSEHVFYAVCRSTKWILRRNARARGKRSRSHAFASTYP